jgi:hypothetical protein
MRSCTALNLTLQRFFIAPEAAGGVFAGQLLTHASRCHDAAVMHPAVQYPASGREIFVPW